MFMEMFGVFVWCAFLFSIIIWNSFTFWNTDNPPWWSVAGGVVCIVAFIFSGIHFIATFSEWMKSVH